MDFGVGHHQCNSTKGKTAAKRRLTEELRKDMHRQRYTILLTHKDRIQHLKRSQIKVLLDPKSRGSCQFESMSHQLSLFAIHRTLQMLCQEAVEHIREFPALYYDFIIVGDPAKYINGMTKESTHGDDVTLLVPSRLYNIQFLIASADGPEYTVLISPDSGYSEQMFLLTLGYFPEGRGEHYVRTAIESQAKTELLSQASMDGQQSPLFSEPSDRNEGRKDSLAVMKDRKDSLTVMKDRKDSLTVMKVRKDSLTVMKDRKDSLTVMKDRRNIDRDEGQEKH